MDESNYSLDEIVIIKDELKKFLSMKQEELKFGVLLNYVLCNYCDENGISKEVLRFGIYKNFHNFLKMQKINTKDDYSINEMKILLENFIIKKFIYITI
jgi:hypothetical protein